MKTKPPCPPADFSMKDRRKLLQMSQETIAKISGIKLRSYQRYERTNALPLCMEKRLNLLTVLHD